ncbi:AmmeMemoRadiSam system radical SAM enzyme [Stieleria sp. ICT_E10.1]|uniref:AmmeMemoRadiSam system radical SAM enzyme n=1 Tax=Stieleria sedimenti TaxID=2976331 RepID=UPI00217F5F40|nr:AmmeMemoRadiSam system radical SAM enzyme [Stieleria sedimenti]MCS7467900.1 AmmeMemoRadiSam system radical SAM enzyme [Stieleria sedimenti]
MIGTKSTSGGRIADPGRWPARWWHTAKARVVCDLCPRHCALKEGDHGFCFVRQNSGGRMVLNTYGRSTGFCIDPVEKKPLHHFYPGTSVLSFGTAGCNMGCKFCQAWEITKSKNVLDRLSQTATPEMIAEAAVQLGCDSVAFTYNDPVIWAEYAIDTAHACHERGLKTIAVTAGFLCPEPRKAFFDVMDATNVDLKGFTEHFYRHQTLSHLQPVLETLKWIKHESSVWLEITNLVIPGANDDPGEIRQMCQWIRDELGQEVPLHFTAFHPDYRMLETPRTPSRTLVDARKIAIEAGLHYVYVGNVDDPKRQSTYCPDCKTRLIGRRWYDIDTYQLDQNRCRICGHIIAGHFGDKPGHWGTKRVPVDPAALLRSLEPEAIK